MATDESETTNQRDGVTMNLTPEDVADLKRGVGLDFSHVLDGYRLTVQAKEMEGSDGE